MNIEMKSEAESPLLCRREVKAEISFDKVTPSNDDVKKAVAAKLKVDESLVAVKHIYTKFGKRYADVFAYIYASKEALDKIEPKKKEKKQKKEGEEAPADAKKGGK